MAGEPNKFIANRYEIVSKLGVGGTASVFLAHDERLNRDVALKLLNRDLVTPDSARRFQSEAKMASTLSHPNLISVLDFGISPNNEIYLVMDYITGMTLAQFVEQHGPLPIEAAADIFIQICDGIGHAHKQGVLHRDLKSTNVMIADQDSEGTRVLILDFGLAKRTEDGSITRTGVLIGSPLYMSPEHASGQELDARADIYSMGCLMYHALTGIYPIHGDTVLDTLMKQTNESAPTLKQGLPNGEFSDELEEIVEKCLKKDRSQRYGSMRDLRERIKSLPELQDATNIEPRKMELSTSDGESTHPEQTALRSTRTTALIGFAAVVIVVASTFVVLRQASTPPSETHPVPLVDSKFETKRWDRMSWNDGITWSKRFAITDADLADPEQLKGITYLSLWSEPITANGLRSIRHLPLKGLYLKENPEIHDQDLSIVNEIQTLEVLGLDTNEQITDAGLAELYNLKNLRILCLSDNSFTDNAFETIGKFPKLEILYIDGVPNVKGSGLHHLSKLKHLEKLCLDLNPQILPKYLESLGQIKSLKTLYLCDTHADGNVLEKLSTLPYLSELDVKRANIRDKDVPLFQKFSSLKVLYISDNNLSPDVFAQLKVQSKFKVTEREHLQIEFLNKLN